MTNPVCTVLTALRMQDAGRRSKMDAAREDKQLRRAAIAAAGAQAEPLLHLPCCLSMVPQGTAGRHSGRTFIARQTRMGGGLNLWKPSSRQDRFFITQRITQRCWTDIVDTPIQCVLRNESPQAGFHSRAAWNCLAWVRTRRGAGAGTAVAGGARHRNSRGPAGTHTH